MRKPILLGSVMNANGSGAHLLFDDPDNWDSGPRYWKPTVGFTLKEER